MSTVMTQSYRRARDHFEPHDMDPQEQRRLRGLLEQIDYSTYVANREIAGQSLTGLSLGDLQRLATITAKARVSWGQLALDLARQGSSPGPDQAARLAAARMTYEELAEAYEALRRMIERGYASVE